MTEQLRIKRDELAKSHSEVYTDNDFRIRSHVGFECGFDKACAILLPLIEELRLDLKHYAKPGIHEAWRAMEAITKIESVIGEVSK